MMKPWLRAAAPLLLLLSTLTAVAAMDVTLTNKQRQKCSGMYSRKSWGGLVEPFILVKFLPNSEHNQGIEQPTVGIAIWEWKDTLLLGKPADKPVAEVGFPPSEQLCLN